MEMMIITSMEEILERKIVLVLIYGYDLMMMERLDILRKILLIRK